MRKEENDDDAFTLATNGHDSDESTRSKDEPFLLTESPLAEFTTTSEAAESSPKVSRRPDEVVSQQYFGDRDQNFASDYCTLLSLYSRTNNQISLYLRSRPKMENVTSMTDLVAN